jgi:CPA2 family monovalent cation:H+ antiporter-2
MAAPIDPAQFKEAMVVLGAAALVIPVFHRLKLSPVIGFILVGMLAGPYGLGALAEPGGVLSWFTITDAETIAPVAELGIVFLLFMIGLELSFERLKMMRRLVFGLGGLQLGLTAAAIAFVCVALGQPWAPAWVIGFALAMSSTAIVVQVLSERKQLGAPEGRASFAVLLFQDIAVVPVLFAIGMLGARESASAAAFAQALGAALLAIALVILFGRLLFRPLLRQVARTQSPELFLAACLLVILAAGLATVSAGLSMAMGALLAGLMLAETEYRRQVEVLIEPFKGLLLGVFLISIGMTIDLGAIAAQPLAIVAGAAGLILGKAALVAVIGRVFGLAWRTGAKAGLLLGPGGEFGFVILGAGAAAGVLAGGAQGYALALAAITMALIPLIAAASAHVDARRRAAMTPADAAALAPDEAVATGDPAVLIVGHGRVGGVVADMLEEHRVPFMVADADPDVVRRARARGRRAYWGDLSQDALLARFGIDRLRALVVTMDSPVGVEKIVRAARAARPDLLIVTRAQDAREAARLYALGASDAVPDTVEASLQLSEAVLLDLGIAAGPVIASVHEKRDAFRRAIKGDGAIANPFHGRRKVRGDGVER